jgi:hypothetical protein
VHVHDLVSPTLLSPFVASWLRRVSVFRSPRLSYNRSQVPYLKSGNHHDFGHEIHRFSFGPEGQGATTITDKMAQVKKKLGIHDPLTGVKAHTEESQYMFQ